MSSKLLLNLVKLSHWCEMVLYQAKQTHSVVLEYIADMSSSSSTDIEGIWQHISTHTNTHLPQA